MVCLLLLGQRSASRETTISDDQLHVYNKLVASLFGITPNSGAVGDTNSDSAGNPGNIRFRHLNNTKANALMLDGHVQTFTYNKITKTSDLLRRMYVCPRHKVMRG